LFVKIYVFGAFLAKFFDPMCAYALKISKKFAQKHSIFSNKGHGSNMGSSQKVTSEKAEIANFATKQ